MNQGKLSTTMIKRSIMSYIHGSNPAGVDCATIPTNRAYTFMATEVGTGDSLLSAKMAVIKACNNIWASGGTVEGVEAAYLIPATAREIRIKELTQVIAAACKQCDTKLIGGHTEVTDAVNRVVVTITAIGSSDSPATNAKNAKPDMDIVLSKWVGMESAALSMQNEEKKAKCLERFTENYIAEIEDYPNWLCVREEAELAQKLGVLAMHDVSDGGIFTALWELAEGSNCGFEVNLETIPMRQPTVEVMEVLGENIYREKSSGCLMMLTLDGERLVEELGKIGIPACIIGQTTNKHDKILHNMDEKRYLDKP